MVFQDYQIYAVTIAENVLMRKVKEPGDEILVEHALQFCGLYDKVQNFP